MITLTNQFGHQQQITPLHYHLEGVRMLDSYITTYTGMISQMVDGMRSFKNQLNLTSPLPLAIKHQPE
ncbi:hypothetical protein L596_012801 [Steinernema carpocapsae]|uniref:Uncharacterized protein n=1 Tax=Steinernema carpocapsae TaxID=34508 RepID=A0A4U5NYH8_STECR|nr:hypothetical protein L596_012801 [Steinernema carpocapsae]